MEISRTCLIKAALVILTALILFKASYLANLGHEEMVRLRQKLATAEEMRLGNQAAGRECRT